MNKAKFPDQPFLSCKATAKELFNISMDEDTFVELGWYAYRDIGNVAVDNYIVKLEVDQNGIATLPDNVDTIESVTTVDIPLQGLRDSYHIYSSGLPISNWFFSQSSLNDTIRYFDLGTSDSVAPGVLIGYTFIDQGRIKVNNSTLQGNEIYVVYKGVIVDDSCLPLLTFKESQAIAYRVAFLKTQRDAFMMKPGSGDLLQYIRMESNRLMQAAKIPEYITQNEFDNILDNMVSWDRKGYGRAFKPNQGR